MKSRVFKFAAFALAAVMTFQTAEVTAVAASKDSAVVTEAKAVSIKQNKNVKKFDKTGSVSINQQIGKNKINTLTDDTFEFMLTAKNGEIASVSLNFTGVTFKQAKRSVSLNAAEQSKAGKAVKAYYTVSGNEIKRGKKDTPADVNPFSVSFNNLNKTDRVYYITKNPEFAATKYTLAKGTAKLFFTYESGSKTKTLKVSVPVVEKAAKFKATQSKDDKKLDPSVSANSVSVNTVSKNAADLAKATIVTNNGKSTYKNVPKISALKWLNAGKKVKVANKAKSTLGDAVDVFVLVNGEYKQIDEKTELTGLDAEELTVYVAPQTALKEKASYKVKLGVTYADQSKNKASKTVTVTAKVVK